MRRTTRNFITMLASQAFICMVSIAAIAGPASPEFSSGKTWNWQLSPPYNLAQDVNILNLDLDEVKPEDMTILEQNGVTSICYVSVGTLENWRTDIDQFPDEIIGKAYGDWPDEKFLDISALDLVLPLMQARFERCANAGFNAIEPDNMDVFGNDSGFDISRAQSVTYFKKLAEIAHKLGLKIAQKNVPELSPQLSDTFDFAVTESCYQDDSCHEYELYAEKGKAILDAEYSDRPIDFEAACIYATDNKISMILKDRDLTQSYQACPIVH